MAILSVYYVYILFSQKDNKFYIGFTANLKRRLAEHENGQVISTAKRRPVILILYEAYREEQDARNREKFFKTTRGKVLLRKQLTIFLEKNNAQMAQW
jgi:putative endonuclease